MRYSEINPLIFEAPMNPGAYNKAIDTGHTKGVLVGFEFECVVPKLAIQNTRPEKTGRTKESVSQILSDDNILNNMDVTDLKPKDFDKLFKFLPGKSQYPDMVTAYTAFNNHLIEKAKELFNKIPEKIRIKVTPLAKEKSKVKPGNWQPTTNRQQNFAYQFGRIIANDYSSRRNGGSPEIGNIGRQLTRMAGGIDYDEVFKFTFPSEDYNHIVSFLDFDPEVVYRKFDLNFYDEDDHDEDDDYKGAVSVLKPALEQSMGRKVTVFNRYHERNKNMTDWYIEPDGSLTGDNDGDGTAEVVSPPLPAKEAITALRNFYGIAAKMGIYTNDSTGLHINVSIPDTLDILKLAVFSGDQYVLKNFDRLNSDYAQSVTRDIQKADSKAMQVKQGPARDKNVFGQRKQNTVIDTKLLQKIAKDISKDHMASISYNGKWVSFRHAGGDYLKDYTEIYNVVGRFVRAIIIASDPTMYQNEYKAAVAKMVGPANDAPDDSLQSILNYISTKGMPVVEVYLAFKGAGVMKPKAMFKKVCERSYDSLPDYNRIHPENLTIIPNSPDAKQKMLAVARDNGPFREWAATATPDKFATVMYAPANQYQINKILARELSRSVINTYGAGGNKNGFYAMGRSVIPGTDPRARKIMLDIRKEYYRIRQQKAAQQARAR